MSKTKEKTNTPYQDDLNEAVHKKRWVPLGGTVVLVGIAFLIGVTLVFPNGAQVTMESNPDGSLYRFGSNPPKTETYAHHEDDPRVIAWVGNPPSFEVLRQFTIFIGIPASHDYFSNCSNLAIKMYSPDQYKAHLYIVSDMTSANMSFDQFGNPDSRVKQDVTGGSCALLIQEAHPDAKVLCLGVNNDNLTDCHGNGFYIMHEDETMKVDTLSEFEHMTFFEGMVRDLVEVPLAPPPDPE